MKKIKLLTLLGAMVFSLMSCFDKGTTEVDDGLIHVTFDTCISLKTNNIKEQVYEVAHKVKKPVVVIIDENPDSLELYGWYKDKEYTTPWNFKTDLATESMTLYAKFVSQYEVKYYQGIDENNISLLATELVFKGDVVPVREDLPDCYENPGNYYLSNVVTEDGITKGTVGNEVKFAEDIVTAPTNILMKRSSNFYLSPGAISRRFSAVAANGGVNGSRVGRIEIVDQGTPDEAAKIDFGEISDSETVCDPYIIMDNPAIDVTNSEYIEITMKNPGVGSTLSFYWVGKWEVNGEWINGKEYHSFAEDRRFAFAKGNGEDNYNTGTVYKDLNSNSYQNNDNEWRTYLLPISKKMYNGVSTWGCAGKITALRIQSSFVIKREKDGTILPENKNNVLYIKSIKGVHDTENTYEFKDSSDIETLKANDDENELVTASNAQTQIDGFVFPKNNSSIVYKNENDTNQTNYTTGNVYKKTDGTYFASEYVDGQQQIVLNPVADIDLDNKSTFVFSYRNFSYASKLTFELKVEYEDKGYIKNKTITSTYNMNTRMQNSVEAEINFFGTANYRGVLKQLIITYNPIGIDNVIKFEYLKFLDYKPQNVNGFNFNDKYYGYFEKQTGLDFAYTTTYKATKVTVSNSNAQMFKEVTKFDNSLMKGMKLNYVNPNGSITAVKLSLTVNGTEKTYVTNVSRKTSLDTVSFSVPETGAVTKVALSFEGTGEFYIKSLLWDFLDDSLNFVSSDFYTAYTNIGGLSHFKYDNTELALYCNTNSNPLYGRLGAWKYSVDGKKVVNLSMAGKTKILLMYQNRSTGGSNPYLSFGAVSKAGNETNNAYLTKDALPNYEVTLNDTTKKPGVGESNRVAVEKGMVSGQWAVAEFALDSFYTSAEYEAYLSCFYFQTASVTDNFYIRAFALI